MLEFFPHNKTPRPCQVDAAEQLVKVWPNAEVIVLRAPTGAGKLALGMMVGKYAVSQGMTAAYIVPDGNLQQQAEAEYPEVASVWGGFDYRCVKHPANKCGQVRKLKCFKDCEKVCPHKLAVDSAKVGLRIMHYATYLGTRKMVGYPDVLIADEAHRLGPFHQDAGGVALWHHEHKWPDTLVSHADVVNWIDTRGENAPGPAGLRKKAHALLVGKGDVWVQSGLESYRNREERCLRVRPLTVRGSTWPMWPSRVKKIVLLSATINSKTVYELGMGKGRREAYIDVASPIPAAARPVFILPWVYVSMKSRELSIRETAEYILEAARHHEGLAGLVHATYSDALEYRRYLTSDRFMWHDHTNKSSVYQEFLRTGARQGRILVGSGLHEGVDLKGDLARWQVLTKLPTPDLGNPAVALKAERDPEWYDSETVMAFTQACGRVCRGPTDYGITYLFDMKIIRLYEERKYMFPSWLREAMRW